MEHIEGLVWVKEYTRKDGRVVKGQWKVKPTRFKGIPKILQTGAEDEQHK